MSHVRSVLFMCVCAIATCGIYAQNATSDSTAQPQQTVIPMPDVSSIGGLMVSLQAQQLMSHAYGAILLDYQSTMSWMQVAQGSLGLAEFDLKNKRPAGFRSRGRRLEEDEDEDEDEEEEEEFVPMPFPAGGAGVPGADRKTIEMTTESAWLMVSKLMYLQASNKLQATSRAYYIMRLQVATAQSAGVNVGALLSILYYREITRLMSAGITIQRQDSLNTYVTLESVETHAEKKSSALYRAIDTSFEHSAMMWFQEASLDFQIWMLDYYLSMYGVPSFITHNNNNNHNSFLEVESTAEPSKPFFSPAATTSYLPYLNLYVVYLHYTAAQSVYVHAHMKNHPELSKDPNVISQSQVMSFHMIYQWAYTKFFATLLTMYGTFGMGFGGAAPAAGAMSF